MAWRPNLSTGESSGKPPRADAGGRPPQKVLVTGASGSLGGLLCQHLERLGWDVYPTDLWNMDVRNEKYVWTHFNRCRPDLVLHLAGLKLAVDGELEPLEFARTNILGTGNIVKACGKGLARIPMVFASTCKAADPETAYGASKLIAERIVLNAGQTVLRLFNILESGPSVLDIWRQIPSDQPIPYTDCWRFFVTADQAIESLLAASQLPPGRYAPYPGEPRHMRDVASQLFPGRELIEIPRRRGDRHVEPLHAYCEETSSAGGLLRIRGPHDPEPVEEETTAWLRSQT